ncbi:glycosyl hydrolase family 28-related protein [Chitinophaga sp. Ak27]|uniref:glycosyl hydrolase family 28-related protein n=1 Tax=Chitinophaga sp. Ak27 TaxID=2726116 RepID=UPI00145EB169|nr:glycosyl hydrolase family 28-related protein [Chitinophaga sp. Ak27]NLU94415.1 hypothetical protein [Chitinophaga sp. Ak27]
MTRYFAFFMTSFFIVFSIKSTAGQKRIKPSQSIINVKDFGAKGDGVTDDADAIIQALTQAVKTNSVCYIPKTTRFYNISKTIRLSLNANDKITINSDGATIRPIGMVKNESIYNITSYPEHVFLSLGPREASSDVHKAFVNNDGVSVNVKGLCFDGRAFQVVSLPPKNDADIAIALQVSAQNINVSNCTFQNIFGYGIRLHGASTLNVNSTNFARVGGRGKTPSADKVDFDAFGDAIYISSLRENASVSIASCTMTGIKSGNMRSRVGITFEYSSSNYNANIKGCDVRGYAKCIHIEEKNNSTFNINQCKFADFNYAIANIRDNATMNFYNCTFTVGLSDGKDNGSALVFLSMYGMPTISVYKSTLDYSNSAQRTYQSVVGLKLLKDCIINANNKNFYFADSNVTFDGCTFQNFGGAGASFFSNSGKNKFVIMNSRFSGGGDVHANGTKASLNFMNSNVSQQGRKLIEKATN